MTAGALPNHSEGMLTAFSTDKENRILLEELMGRILFQRVVCISIVIQLVELVWKFTHYYSDDNQKCYFFNFL